MGDRYTLTVDSDAVASRFGVDVPDHYQPRYNAAPTQLLPVITQQSKGLSYFYWGQTPERAKNHTLSKKLIYADGEWLKEKASLRNALSFHRCMIPADSYYDWKRISKKGRVAHRVLFGNTELVGIAGLWEEFENEQGEVAHTFRIITSPAPSQELGERVPSVVKKAQEHIWLGEETDPEKLMTCIGHYPADKISMYTVSPQIEDVEKDHPGLIGHFAPADQFGNYSLFD